MEKTILALEILRDMLSGIDSDKNSLVIRDIDEEIKNLKSGLGFEPPLFTIWMKMNTRNQPYRSIILESELSVFQLLERGIDPDPDIEIRLHNLVQENRQRGM